MRVLAHVLLPAASSFGGGGGGCSSSSGTVYLRRSIVLLRMCVCVCVELQRHKIGRLVCACSLRTAVQAHGMCIMCPVCCMSPFYRDWNWNARRRRVAAVLAYFCLFSVFWKILRTLLEKKRGRESVSNKTASDHTTGSIRVRNTFKTCGLTQSGTFN